MSSCSSDDEPCFATAAHLEVKHVGRIQLMDHAQISPLSRTRGRLALSQSQGHLLAAVEKQLLVVKDMKVDHAITFSQDLQGVVLSPNESIIAVVQSGSVCFLDSRAESILWETPIRPELKTTDWSWVPKNDNLFLVLWSDGSVMEFDLVVHSTRVVLGSTQAPPTSLVIPRKLLDCFYLSGPGTKITLHDRITGQLLTKMTSLSDQESSQKLSILHTERGETLAISSEWMLSARIPPWGLSFVMVNSMSSFSLYDGLRWSHYDLPQTALIPTETYPVGLTIDLLVYPIQLFILGCDSVIYMFSLIVDGRRQGDL